MCACGCVVYRPISPDYCSHSLSSHSYVIMKDHFIYFFCKFAVELLYCLGCAKAWSTFVTVHTYVSAVLSPQWQFMKAYQSLIRTYIQTYIYLALYMPSHSNN